MNQLFLVNKHFYEGEKKTKTQQVEEIENDQGGSKVILRKI